MKKITLLVLFVFTITTQGQNKLLSSIHESNYSGTWEKNYGNNYEYDSNNNLIAETFLQWDSVSSTWKILEKTNYTYNLANKVTQEIGQEWNATANSFVNSYRDTYTYTNGNFTSQVAEVWENSAWVNEWRIVLTYNGNNLPVSALSYNWENSQWENEERVQLSYDANNKNTSYTNEEYIGGQWVNSIKSLIDYNVNNKIIAERSAEWDDFNSLWKETYRTDYELDATGNRTIETNTDIKNTFKYREEYTYDSFNLMNNFAHPFRDKTGIDYLSEDMPYVNRLLVANSFSYNSSTNTYQNSSKTTYNYNSAITLDTQNIEKELVTVSVFPNPTQDFLSIQASSDTAIDKLEITDLSGKKLLQQSQNTTQVDVQNLSKGMYILTVFSGDKKYQNKFMKE